MALSTWPGIWVTILPGRRTTRSAGMRHGPDERRHGSGVLVRSDVDCDETRAGCSRTASCLADRETVCGRLTDVERDDDDLRVTKLRCDREGRLGRRTTAGLVGAFAGATFEGVAVFVGVRAGGEVLSEPPTTPMRTIIRSPKATMSAPSAMSAVRGIRLVVAAMVFTVTPIGSGAVGLYSLLLRASPRSHGETGEGYGRVEGAARAHAGDPAVVLDRATPRRERGQGDRSRATGWNPEEPVRSILAETEGGERGVFGNEDAHGHRRTATARARVRHDPASRRQGAVGSNTLGQAEKPERAGWHDQGE